MSPFQNVILINHKVHKGCHKEHNFLILKHFSLCPLWFLCVLCGKKSIKNMQRTCQFETLA